MQFRRRRRGIVGRGFAFCLSRKKSNLGAGAAGVSPTDGIIPATCPRERTRLVLEETGSCGNSIPSSLRDLLLSHASIMMLNIILEVRAFRSDYIKCTWGCSESGIRNLSNLECRRSSEIRLSHYDAIRPRYARAPVYLEQLKTSLMRRRIPLRGSRNETEYITQNYYFRILHANCACRSNITKIAEGLN